MFAKSITIAVAANVGYAIKDLKKEFNNKYPDIKIKTVLGSSGKLTAQISHGASFDLFMSADMHYPNTLYKNSFALTPPRIYAKGLLSIFSTKKLDFSKGITLLKDSNIKKIAIANPKTAPYGKATIEAFKSANIYDHVKDKLIYAESISQAIAYASLASDVGIVATSALYSKNMKKYKKGINWIEVDPKLYTPIKQGVVILKNSDEANKFYNFIFTKNAKDIFKKYGYIVDD